MYCMHLAMVMVATWEQGLVGLASIYILYARGYMTGTSNATRHHSLADGRPPRFKSNRSAGELPEGGNPPHKRP